MGIDYATFLAFGIPVSNAVALQSFQNEDGEYDLGEEYAGLGVLVYGDDYPHGARKLFLTFAPHICICGSDVVVGEAKLRALIGARETFEASEMPKMVRRFCRRLGLRCSKPKVRVLERVC